jgi:hypothetical protein
VVRSSILTPNLQVTWSSIEKGDLPSKEEEKTGRGVKYSLVVAAVGKVKESYQNLSVIVQKLQVIAHHVVLSLHG